MPTRERRAKSLGIPVAALPDGRGKHKHHARSAAHPRWSGGRIMSGHGYVKVRVGPAHPLADQNGYAYEHLLVWVSSGRAAPIRHEVLHHKNEVRTDNRLSNLELLTRSAHNHLHLAERERDARGRIKRAGHLLDGREHREFPR